MITPPPPTILREWSIGTISEKAAVALLDYYWGWTSDRVREAMFELRISN